MKRLLQHYAKDENNNLIDIKNTDENDNKKYFCPNCNGEMIARRGTVRQWHFAHKSDQCSYDKYLHTIAEILISDWFNRSSVINLHINNMEVCASYDKCKFHDEVFCTRTLTELCNLKQYYSSCSLEKSYKGHVADIYCESPKEDNPPIFFEIFVTHECSEEKKKSGIRIVEFLITSEEDIQRIISGNDIIEEEKTRLYNFRRMKHASDDITRMLQKYILYPSLKRHVDRESYNCKNFNSLRNGIFEICIPYDDEVPFITCYGGLYEVGKILAHRSGLLKKECMFCKWSAMDFYDDYLLCKLHRKCGNPKYCEDNNASTCQMYKEESFYTKTRDEDFFHNADSDVPYDVWRKE